MMNIFAQPGHKIVFRYAHAGYPNDQRRVAGRLFPDQVYTVQRIETQGPRVNVWLVEHPGVMFNTVHFEDYVG